MKPATRRTVGLAAAFVALVLLAGTSREAEPGPMMKIGITASPPASQPKAFEAADTDGDGYLSLAEFKALGLDDLAFRAADIGVDGRISPKEYDRWLKARADDPSTSGRAGHQEPAGPPAK